MHESTKAWRDSHSGNSGIFCAHGAGSQPNIPSTPPSLCSVFGGFFFFWPGVHPCSPMVTPPSNCTIFMSDAGKAMTSGCTSIHQNANSTAMTCKFKSHCLLFKMSCIYLSIYIYMRVYFAFTVYQHSGQNAILSC